MKTSVALCTYNGEKFLEQQIDSILNQTIKVDEIVVCDDQSTDTTVSILNSYKEKYPEIFKIHLNEKNLRSVKNFEKAISICENEIIFLCDQDDVWTPEKVEKVKATFGNKPEISTVATNGFGIDDENNILDIITIWDVPKFVMEQGYEFNHFNILNLIGNFCTGATMAFRKEIKQKILPIPIIDGFHHDEWIALIAAQKNELYFIDEKLIFYRAHSSQQVGGVFYKNTEKEKKSLTDFFSIEKSDKNFKDYKRLLKRLSLAYKKNLLLQEDNLSQKEYFENNLLEIKLTYLKYKKEMTKKFPLKAKILNISDEITNKRKI